MRLGGLLRRTAALAFALPWQHKHPHLISSSNRGRAAGILVAMAESSSSSSSRKEYYRPDGVRICHDPYDPELRAKYGSPGRTDPEGFDPVADTVGPGIYGGTVQRDEKGEVVIGEQYQSHNPRPGPVYAGGGYTSLINALRIGPEAVEEILTKHPELVDEVTTGGARPLHMCGMSRRNQLATALLIEKGADIEAVDTYGYRPLHRMASNNLAVGVKALLDAGADPKAPTAHGETPMQVARSSAAWDVVQLLIPYYT